MLFRITISFHLISFLIISIQLYFVISLPKGFLKDLLFIYSIEINYRFIVIFIVKGIFILILYSQVIDFQTSIILSLVFLLVLL